MYLLYLGGWKYLNHWTGLIHEVEADAPRFTDLARTLESKKLQVEITHPCTWVQCAANPAWFEFQTPTHMNWLSSPYTSTQNILQTPNRMLDMKYLMNWHLTPSRAIQTIWTLILTFDKKILPLMQQPHPKRMQLTLLVLPQLWRPWMGFVHPKSYRKFELLNSMLWDFGNLDSDFGSGGSTGNVPLGKE